MTRKVRHFWAADCETDPFDGQIIPEPFIFGIVGGPSHEYHMFYVMDEFVNFMREIDGDIYFHNGGKFDTFYFRGEANVSTQYPPEEPILMINSRLSDFGLGEARILDSFNLLPTKLANLRKEKFEYSILREDRRDIPANKILIADYLRSDCVNLHAAVTAHRLEHGVTKTQAGAAMRAMYKSKGIRPPKQTPSEFQCYRRFMAGGHVQCFPDESGAWNRIGVDMTLADINSAYPRAMRLRHPYSTSGIVSHRLPNIDDMHKSMIEFDGISRGGLFCRDSKGNIYYPDDKKVHRFCVPGYELIAALECESVDIVRHIESHIFTHTVHAEEFIDLNWNKRTEAKARGDLMMSTIYKLNMNSAYGKHGADPSEYEETILCHPDRIAFYESHGYTQELWWRHDKMLMSRPLPEEKQRFYNVAYAASITGCVRGEWHRGYSACQGVVYGDTDSILAIDASRLNFGDGLGQWKNEGVFDAAFVGGKKLYAFHKKNHPWTDLMDDEGNFLHWKTASKGARLLPSEIVAMCQGKQTTYHPQAPTYSVRLERPVFIPRNISITAKDVRYMSEVL